MVNIGTWCIDSDRAAACVCCLERPWSAALVVAGIAWCCHCCMPGGGYASKPGPQRKMQASGQLETCEAVPTFAMMSPSLVLMSARDPEGAGGLTATDSAYTQGCPDFRVLMRSFDRTRWTGAALLAIRGICCCDWQHPLLGLLRWQQ